MASLALGRERRANAGRRMAALLDEKEGDLEEFYQTTYGGFKDEVDDRGKRNQKRGGVFTKAYKEPAPLQKPRGAPGRPRKSAAAVKTKAEQKQTTADSTVVESPTRSRRVMSPPGSFSPPWQQRRFMRHSTKLKSKELKEREREREAVSKKIRAKLKRKQAERAARERPLTQAELMREAKETEKKNLKSLEEFRVLEETKKKARTLKRPSYGPMIRYSSRLIRSGTEEAIVEHSVAYPTNAVFRSWFPRETKSPESPKRSFCYVHESVPAKYRMKNPGDTGKHPTWIPCCSLSCFNYLNRLCRGEDVRSVYHLPGSCPGIQEGCDRLFEATQASSRSVHQTPSEAFQTHEFVQELPEEILQKFPRVRSLAHYPGRIRESRIREAISSLSQSSATAPSSKKPRC
ncbi:unnamed protein product [Cyprideis torosa]|uniref:Vps72/YL1 N-terminal domain-containing protein n=1 Tax=Cyprideis torosa TaxID=163714 RepID=A0A7R8WTB7_9CRUS|nr:unnamed protein product [Cyprideis torosa]CAG0905598.1 unnamed protein product [Cyprideis torosa]